MKLILNASFLIRFESTKIVNGFNYILSYVSCFTTRLFDRNIRQSFPLNDCVHKPQFELQLNKPSENKIKERIKNRRQIS